MSTSVEKTLVISKKSIKEYLIEIALLFQESTDVVVLKGHGKFISKAVDLYNAILSRMKDSVELINVSIGSDIVKGKVKPYIAIKIKRRY